YRHELQRPAGATPLPYTTLFRSEDAAALALEAGVDLSLWGRSFTRLEAAIDEGLVEESALRRAAARVLALKRRIGLLGDGDGGGDRKSTRLNSSHVSISYAVFCL